MYINLTIYLYDYYNKEGKEVGNIIKINIYAEYKRKRLDQLKLKMIQETIIEYNNWLRKNKREDKIENYEEFLQAQ